MIEENRTKEVNGQASLSLGWIIAAVLLVLLSLGGLIYFFITPVP
jgi:hypothetical protein